MSNAVDRASIGAQLSDWPDWLAPVLVKDLRLALRTPLFLVPFAGIHLAGFLSRCCGICRRNRVEWKFLPFIVEFFAKVAT
mgnify:CR=1 FL=1|jgi:hypothetical protein